MLQYLRYFFLVLVTLCISPQASRADALGEALVYHAYFSGAEEVQRLLNKGADPNAKDSHGWTALAIASDRNDANATPVAAALISKGANINLGKDNNYPLINAIKNNNTALVALLLEHNVNIRIRDPKGRSPLALAKEMGNVSVAYFIEKKIFEENQLQAYLRSGVHQRQVLGKFAMENCQFQYWSFYLKSKQDSNIDEAALMKRITEHARNISALSMTGAQYFPAFQEGKHNLIAAQIRKQIFDELNNMISNRNRRELGVGQESDMQKRCGIILKNILHLS